MGIRLTSGSYFADNSLLTADDLGRHDTLQLMNNGLSSPPIELDATAEIKIEHLVK
jgi:hypothetical protein